MKKTKVTRSLLAAVSIIALSAVAYGCSSGINQSDADRQAMEAAAAAAAAAAAEAAEAAEMAEEARKARIAAARTAIEMAATDADAQAAYDGVKDIATVAEGEMLQAAITARSAVLAMMAREAAQKMALMNAAGMIDTTDLSTQDAVDAARAAIVMLRGALATAADVSEADKAMYMSMLDDAVMAVDTAQGGINTATRRMNQMAALTGASGTLQAALAALSGSTPTQAQLDAAKSALYALNAAIKGGMDLTDAEKATYQREATNAAAPISTAQTAFDNAEDVATKAANAAMAATAAKLYAGIGATPLAGHAVTVDGTTGVWSVDPAAVGAVDLTNQALTEDKKTAVADHYGWEGKSYTAAPTTGTYEAIVYSNVGEPEAGAKFNVEYTLDGTTGETGEVSGLTGYTTARVASPSFDQDAGTKTFERGTNLLRITLSGSYHGVSGTYYCAPTGADAAANQCTSTIAEQGFTLGGGTWTFKPSNPNALVMTVASTTYASYGWWIHKAANDGGFTASAFAIDRGDVADATGITALRGKATYMGGAAGKYALSSSTGGTNDAGHFTARAMLEADFNADMITGTIDNFMGADGTSRNWSVTLNNTDVADGGVIDGTDAASVQVGTVWTIDGTKAATSGQWSGNLQDNGDDGVPKVGSGTFSSTYGGDGRMVGAFGVNKQ